ncbi:MAG: lactate utilization protein C [Actinomycetes bacterium]
MSARDEILSRVRAALRDVPRGSGPDEVEVPRSYVRTRGVADVPDLFAERVADYRATVVRIGSDGVREAVREALAGAQARRVVVPDGVPGEWLPGEDTGIEIVRDSPPLPAHELDHVDAVVTGAAVGIATTGTIVLDHEADQGRRALTLVPDVHVCVVRESQVTDDVPDGVQRLAEAVAQRRPLTWISGPSATSDIELDRVEGVHGPRTLHVILVADSG